MEAEQMLDPHDAAKLLRVSVRTLEGWRRTGEGPPFIRCGRLARYRHADVSRWIADRRRASTSADRPPREAA